jgi:hypothetical protein
MVEANVAVGNTAARTEMSRGNRLDLERFLLGWYYSKTKITTWQPRENLLQFSLV